MLICSKWQFVDWVWRGVITHTQQDIKISSVHHL